MVDVDKAPRLSISIVIWILSSDTICQLNQFHTNSEAVMLSKQLSSTTLKMKCMVVTVFSKRSLALRKSTGQQCSFTSGRLANTKR